MKAKRVLRRAISDRDLATAVEHDVRESGNDVALRFIDAVERAYARIGRQPGVGSPRYAHELSIAELRSWPIRRFPYVVFYVERSDRVDIWRLLHAHRDIPKWMRASNEE